MSTKKITTAHKGRRCKFPGCKRILSIYNHDVNCHIHLNRLSERSRQDDFENVMHKAVVGYLESVKKIFPKNFEKCSVLDVGSLDIN